MTPAGRPASQVHTARLRPARWELVSRAAVWAELERRGVVVATVPFRGRAGRGGEIDVIRLQQVRDGVLREVRLWAGVDELANALAAPVWGRFGTFAGQPLVRAEAIWTAIDHSVAIVGRCGDRRIEEVVVRERAIGSSRTTSGVSAGQSPLFP